MAKEKVTMQKLEFGPRRGVYIDIGKSIDKFEFPERTLKAFEDYDLVYRTLCGILYNFVPTSGHPGGSISSGRHVAGILFHTLDYDIGDPECPEADLVSYAAGHKAMGLYAMWALRNEVARIGKASLLPKDAKFQLRFEDLLGFRRNPTQETPLFAKYRAKPLDGHPTPATPFIKLSTGASGVGVGSSFGLAFGAMDTYGENAPLVQITEGEGGMTPGRVAEAFATVSAAQLWNIKFHIDWNQASIDSNRVCRDGDKPGDYVQWDPIEFAFLHDWNVIFVEKGHDFRHVLAACEVAKERINNQPTAIVYRTTKGWQYGIEGRKSHGAGHKFCSPEYYKTLEPFEKRFGVTFPKFEGKPAPVAVEQNFWDTLMILRKALEGNRELCEFFAGRLEEAKGRLKAANRVKRPGCPNLDAVYSAKVKANEIPPECTYKIGSEVTLRGALGDALNHLNKLSGGGFIGAAADLLGSTSISNLANGFPEGFYNAVTNPNARLVTCGGICEDAMGSFMAGVASYGTNVGAGSSYGAFIAALEHIAARLHGIGQQARHDLTGKPHNPFIIVCGHAGLKTGEDGPTHADPQPLQLLQENFPDGIAITLTPWDPQELYPLTVEAIKARPAVIAPFVTRPNEPVLDRKQLRLPPATAAVKGVYALRKAVKSAKKPYHGTIVLQESGVACTFMTEVLPKIDEAGLNMNIYYVSSAELFSRLPAAEQERIFPAALAAEAMGITGFTLPTMYRWITSKEGRKRTIHAFTKGRFLGSGQAHKVLEEAGLHGEGQWKAVKDYARLMAKTHAPAPTRKPARRAARKQPRRGK
jgi:transketolase